MGAAAAIAIGTAVAGVGSAVISGNRAKKEAAAARAAAGDQQAAAQLQLREAVEKLEAVGVPSIEAQRIVLEQPELVGLQDVHEIAFSEMSQIESDPKLRDAQMQGLDQIQEIAETGRTAGEKAQEQLDTRSVAAQEQARRKAILQSMAERGMAGSGQELAALLQGSQSAADRKAQMQAQLIKDREARKMAAIQQAATLGGQIRGQEFGEQSKIASAEDAIKQFNIANRMNVEAANLARQQNIADEQTRLSNLQQQYNKELIQRQHDNEMAKATAIANAKTGQATQHQRQAQAELNAGASRAAGELQQGAAITGLIGQVGGIAAGAVGKGGEGTVSKMPVGYSPENAQLAPTGGSNLQFREDGGLIYADGGVAPMMLPQQPEGPSPMSPPIQSPSPTGYAGGGVAVDGGEDDRIIPGNEFAGDRVDAKVNSGEMVLNVEQQQRLMELLKGYRDLSQLGKEDIVDQPQAPQAMEDGGVAEQDNEEDFVSKLSKEHSKLTLNSHQLKDAQKDTNAKIKALETLMGKK